MHDGCNLRTHTDQPAEFAGRHHALILALMGISVEHALIPLCFEQQSLCLPSPQPFASGMKACILGGNGILSNRSRNCRLAPGLRHSQNYPAARRGRRNCAYCCCCCCCRWLAVADDLFGLLLYAGVIRQQPSCVADRSQVSASALLFTAGDASFGASSSGTKNWPSLRFNGGIADIKDRG